MELLDLLIIGKLFHGLLADGQSQQVMPVTPADWAPAISTIINTGAVLWFFYYTNTVSPPAQAKDHREMIDKINADNAMERATIRKELKETIDALIAEIKQQREMYYRLKSDQKG